MGSPRRHSTVEHFNSVVLRPRSAMIPQHIVEVFETLARDTPVFLPATTSAPNRQHLGLEEIDRALCVNGLREPFFALSNSTTGIVPFNSWPFHNRWTSCADPSVLLVEILRSKTTLILRHAQINLPSIRALALSIQQVSPFLSVEINCYLTPPNAKGIRPHSDPRDTILIQQHGSKCWSAWPLSCNAAILEPQEGRPTVPSDHCLEVVLSRGDALFIPAGCVHAAETQEDYSLHLTIGLLDSRKVGPFTPPMKSTEFVQVI